MADDSDDVIYVDLEPRLSDSATERETEKLRDKLKSGARGIGKSVGDEFHSEFSQRLEDSFRGVSGKLHGLAIGLGKTFDASDILGNWDGVQAKFKTVDDLAKQVGIDISDWGPKADDAKSSLTGFDSGVTGTLDKVKEFSSIFDKMPGKIGAAASKMAGLAGEVGLVVAGLEEAQPYIEKLDQKIHDSSGIGKWLEEHSPEKLPQWVADRLGAKHSRQFFGNLFGYDPTLGHGPSPSPTSQGDESNAPYPPTFIGPIPQGTVRAPGGVAPATPRDLSGIPPGQGPNFYKDWYPPTGKSHARTSGFSTGGSRFTLADFTTPTTPTVSGPEDIPAAAAGVGNLYRFAESLVGTPYSQPLRNDCSGMVSELANVAVGLPPPTAGQRFSTVDEGQRLAQLGFQTGTGGPNDLNIGWYDHGGGNFGHTAATLPGGINAESGGSHGSFLLGPGAAGASSPQFDHHMFLPMGPESYLGSPRTHVRLTGFGAPLTPADLPGPSSPADLPGIVGAYAPPPTQGNTYSPTSQPGLGHGSGLGISGGAIGLAEQAGAMAAGAFSFGGGAIAAQVMEQEINLAVQKGGQAAAVAAKAPFETFGLHGGQMGAPSVDPGGGWIGKILGGMIGQQFNAPNIAGTQQPKQPQGQDAHEDPGAAKPQGGGGTGPAGSREDPFHTKIVGGTQPPQGALTSAMTTQGIMSAMV